MSLTIILTAMISACFGAFVMACFQSYRR